MAFATLAPLNRKASPLRSCSGDNQQTLIKNAFAQPLLFDVTAHAADEPVIGGTISLIAPSSGASLNSANSTVTIAASGSTSTTLIANRVTGSYSVTASIGAANTPFDTHPDQSQP